MCCNTCGCEPKSVTLQTAIVMMVKMFVKETVSKQFSIHHVTNAIREKCNSGVLEIPECEDSDPSAPYRFNIEHAKVRSLFNEMWDCGVFSGDVPSLTRRHNGRYWEFSGLAVNNSDENTDVLPDDKPVPPTLNCTIDPEIKRRIKIYLENCGKIPVFPTLKQVQSAIHRSRGTNFSITQDELRGVVSEMGLMGSVSV